MTQYNDIPLWTGLAPYGRGTSVKDFPTVRAFLPEKANGPTSAVLICPGGGYDSLCSDYEGYNEAAWFQQHGIAGLVLQYRLPGDGYPHPVPLLDAQRAMRFVRSHAMEWNIDPAKIGVMGFSAGGHLASTLATHFDGGNAKAADAVDRLASRPDFALLVYPVITLKTKGVTHEGSKRNLLGPSPMPELVDHLSSETQVTPQTPPTLFVHSADDEPVPIENSRLMHAALQKAGVPTRLDEYQTGGHGFGLGRAVDISPAKWMDRVAEWMASQGF